MAPQTKADISTVAKLLEIKRTIWTEATGIAVATEDPKRSNGYRNKNPKVNADIRLLPFKTPDGEETTKIYIADPWPVDYDAIEANEIERRISGGQGPRIKVGQVAFDDKGQPQGIVFGSRLSPTKKHWSRGERRAKAAAARASRKRNRKSA